MWERAIASKRSCMDMSGLLLPVLELGAQTSVLHLTKRPWKQGNISHHHTKSQIILTLCYIHIIFIQLYTILTWYRLSYHYQIPNFLNRKILERWLDYTGLYGSQRNQDFSLEVGMLQHWQKKIRKTNTTSLTLPSGYLT